MIPRRAVLSSLLAASCASPTPALYTLDAPSGPIRRGGPRTIELRNIGLARYLERSQIVRSTENYRLDVLANDWWGEPLDAMLGRVLIRALSQRLPGSTIYQENGAISAEPEVTIQVNVQRMDQDARRDIRLIAQFSVRRHAADTRRADTRGADTRAATIQVPVSAPGARDLVAGMSEAVGQLADRIAAALAAG